MISYNEALHLTLTEISPLQKEVVDISQAIGRIVAEDTFALVDSPTIDVSLKDGYAIQSADIASAKLDNPVVLKLLGTATAGNHWEGEVSEGTAVRILSGAAIPSGAQAVVSDEFASDDGALVTVTNHSEPGRNILPKGNDVRPGQLIIETGTVLFPTMVGHIAASGHANVSVMKQPKVAIIATGDEVIAPGTPLTEGKLYASNLVTLTAWCNHFGLATSSSVVEDQEEHIRKELTNQIQDHDAILTSGGAWKGDRDLVVKLLDDLGWMKVYHRVRIGPGKAVGFGLLEGKPIFCLPGGPPSNHMAFLQLALPGLQKLAGNNKPGLRKVIAYLTQSISGMRSWTQFIHGCLKMSENKMTFQPLKLKSRLQMMAQANAIGMIPEGTETILAETMIPVQVLSWIPPRSNTVKIGCLD
jgi:molybdopterin molybdotransferase